MMNNMSYFRRPALAALAVAVGLAIGDRAAADPLPVSITAGGAQWQALQLNGPLLSWDEADSGLIGGGGDHFDDAMGVRVGGAAYGAPSGQVTVAGNTITGQMQILAGLQATVQYQASSLHPVMRQILTLTNPTGSPINTTVQWLNNAGSDGSTVVIGSSSGDLALGLNDRWVITADSANTAMNDTETNLWVMAGPGNPLVTPSVVTLFESEPAFGTSGNQGLTADYNVTIGAGQTRSLMWFVNIQGTGNAALGFASNFNDTDSPVFQSLISDLSAEQRAGILNSAFAPVQQEVPEPSTLLLVTLGGLALAGIRRRKTAQP